MSELDLTRLMVIAPHPDDETIAAGGLIQRCLAAGGDVRVVFVTDGENNPWPQRWHYKRLRIGTALREDWRAIRRREALAAIEQLGVPAGSARFLSLPDHAVLELARAGDRQAVETFRSEIADMNPSLIVCPSFFDAHSDHRAIAFFVHSACGNTRVVTFIVHPIGRPPELVATVTLTDEEHQRKLAAMQCHASQLALSRTRFLGYASSTESFYAAEHDAVHVESRLATLRLKLRHAALVLGFGT